MKQFFLRVHGYIIGLLESVVLKNKLFSKSVKFMQKSTKFSQSDSFTKSINQISQLSIEELYRRFSSSVAGLNETDVAEKLDTYGANEIGTSQVIKWYKQLWLCYYNPFNILLTVLDLFFFFSNDLRGVAVISLMIILSISIRFIQELRSSISMSKLKSLVSTTATVIRIKDNQKCIIEVNTVDLVPGDILLLSAGDLISVDLRIISAKDLFISQSVLTGESLPVEKFATCKAVDDLPVKDVANIILMGSNIISGTAVAIVIGTAENTLFGTIMHKVVQMKKPNDNILQKEIGRISWMLITFMLIMTPIIFLINGIIKHEWLDSLFFSFSIAVGLTPEMLPVIVTATLAKGAVSMSKKKVVIKRLEAIQTFGAMNILCTDKTGTLTQDRICLESHLDIFGVNNDDVLLYAYLNSYYQTGLKNLLDIAVLDRGNFGDIPDLLDNYSKVDEIPFDFSRKKMSVVVKSIIDDDNLIVCKGAVDGVLSSCDKVLYKGEVLPLSDTMLNKTSEVVKKLNLDGLRVVAVAIKRNDATQTVYGVSDECKMTLIGYVAFMDPPKESTMGALTALNNFGVDVKILTGDNELVTRKVCRDVGLEVEGILSGSDLDALSDDVLAKLVDSTTIFVQLTPLHKERIVNIFKENGNIVGFLGDGINDAAALKVSDIGISVDSAVDVAKDAADIVLLEKNLMVLEDGIEEGRKTFSNMLKYIKITTSSNFGNIFSVLIAAICLPFQPMLPLHLLVLNFLYDMSQTLIPFDNVDMSAISQSHKFSIRGLLRFIIYFGPFSSLFDIITFLVLWYLFKANSVSQQSLFQTGWFLESLVTQMFIISYY